jgi:hypothetical protein
MPEISWRREFPGDAQQLAEVRRWLASLLPESPARDDLALVATELGSNAILYTSSGQGGGFAVEVTWSRGVVRVAVIDGGAAGGPRVVDDPLGEHGRGLRAVRGLSERMGVSGSPAGRTVWADIAWGDADAAEPASPQPADIAADLASRFGVPAWFGQATRQWWALTAPGRDVAALGQLVAAPTAHGLAGLLAQLPTAPVPQRLPGDGETLPGRRGSRSRLPGRAATAA